MRMPPSSPRQFHRPPHTASCASLRLFCCASASRSHGTASPCCSPKSYGRSRPPSLSHGMRTRYNPIRSTDFRRKIVNDPFDYQSIAKTIDHSLLNPSLTTRELEEGCALAIRYDVA